VIGVQKITDKEAMRKYGNVYGNFLNHKTYRVSSFQEKPSLKDVSPHGLIVGGMRYIFTKDIWPILQHQAHGKDNEIWVADAANALAKRRSFYAYEYEGIYFDTGDKVALLKTALHFAFKDPAIALEIKKLVQ